MPETDTFTGRVIDLVKRALITRGKIEWAGIPPMPWCTIHVDARGFIWKKTELEGVEALEYLGRCL